MIRPYKAVFLISLLLLASQANTEPLRGKDLNSALQGAWCVSIDDGKSCWGYEVFSNGSTRSCGQIPDTDVYYLGTTKYKIDGNLLCHVVTTSNQPEHLKIGYRFCTEILDVSDNRLTARDMGSAEVDIAFRVAIEKVTCRKK
jgi:hypothetical protein